MFSSVTESVTTHHAMRASFQPNIKAGPVNSINLPENLGRIINRSQSTKHTVIRFTLVLEASGFPQKYPAWATSSTTREGLVANPINKTKNGGNYYGRFRIFERTQKNVQQL